MTFMNYEQMERKYKKEDHNRKCINGKVTGCGNCVGYCHYREHSGYLTAELRAEHNCLGKGCFYYVEKQKQEKERVVNPFTIFQQDFSKISDVIFQKAQKLIKQYEGMKFLKSSILEDGNCELSYIAISNEYDFGKIATAISDAVGFRVVLKDLDYSFDRKVEILFG